MRLPLVGGLKGVGILVLLLIALFVGGPDLVLRLLGGGDPGALPEESQADGTPQLAPGSTPGAADDGREFLAAILGSTEDVWSELFQAGGSRYAPPRLVLFDDAVQSACGFASAATGPFYCPADRNLYIDLGFFRELARMGGPGDFAQAYVIAHEVGHHVQTLLGTAAEVRELQAGSADQRAANRLQVAMELQADCYAGVWASHANRMQDHNLLEPGDVEEGLAAAAAIGDDRLQRSAGRRISPESFTHGSSADRQRWLETGLRTGAPDACDTFGER